MKIFSRLSAVVFFFLFFVFIPVPAFAEDILSPWFSTTNLPYRLASHTSFSHEDKVYVLDGSAVTGGSHKEIIAATPGPNGNLGGWTVAGHTPTALIWHSSVTSGNYVYVLGGREENSGSANDHVDKVFVANLNNLNSWTQTTSLPRKLSLSAAVTVNNRIYVSGGFNNGHGPYENVYFAQINLNGTLGSWTETTAIPERLDGHSMVEYKNRIYIFGGNGAEFTYRANVNSNGSLGEWISSPKPQEGGVYRGAGIRVGKTIIMTGGQSFDSLNKVFFTTINPDGSLAAWQESTNPLPTTVHAHAITKLGGYLYVTGGHRSQNLAYLDTVYAAKLNIADDPEETLEPNLNVPLLKQNNPAWGSQVYNSANLWSPAKAGIERWGCAMTSAAMVFNFHGITKLPDGQTINPGTLNTWLKTQPDGYVGEGLVNWNALSRLSKVSKSQNPGFTFDALENFRINGFAEAQLKQDLENNIPGILEVPNHFVVGKGTENGKILINDPFYDRTDLTSYSNTFKSLRRFVPSNTDLSSILLVVPSGITLSVKDDEGNVVGEGYLQEPIHDDIGGGTTPKSFFIYEIKKPESGEFTIEVSGSSTQQYELKQYLYDEDGNVKVLASSGIVGNGIKDTFKLSYNKETITSSKTVENVTFESFLADLDLLYAQGKITNLGIYISLKQNTQVAQMHAGMGNKSVAKTLLTTIMGQIDFQKKKFITEDAYQILKPQIQFLISSL